MAYQRRQMHTQGDGNYEGSYPTLNVRDVVGRSYHDSYEAARQNFVPTRTRGGRKATNGGRQYNIKRTDALRVSRGKDSMRQIQEAVDSN